MTKITQKIKLWFVPCQENQYRPDFLDSDFLIYFVILLLALKLAFVPVLTLFSKTSFFAEISKVLLIEMTNKQRQSFGLPALKENPQLEESALLKAEDILNFDYFSHNSPQGKTPWYWIKGAGYDYAIAGENLGIGFLDSEEIYNAWNNSPSHKANLLNSQFEEIGIAVLEGNFDGNKTIVVVQHFGSPKIEVEKPLVAAEIEEEPETTEKPAEETPISPTTTITTEIEKIAGAEAEIEKSPFFNLAKFLTANYSNLIQKIELFSLIFIIISLLVNILISIRIQHKDLICKTVFFGLLLVIFVLINKELILKIIPHNLGIY